jgi:hypothetical protein
MLRGSSFVSSSEGTPIWMSLILRVLACDIILANHRRISAMPAIFATNASDSWKNSIRHVLKSIAGGSMQRHDGRQARISVARLLLSIVCTVGALAGQTAPPALPWTELQPGAYPVGYRALYEFMYVYVKWILYFMPV